MKISYFRTKIVSDNEPLDEIEPFIYLSNHAIRYIHENSNIVVFFIAEVEGWRPCSRRPRMFCDLTPKPSLKMSLTFIIVHLKWLSMNARNSTFSGVFASIKWNPVFVHTLAKYGAGCSISPKTSLRMEGLCSNLQ